MTKIMYLRPIRNKVSFTVVGKRYIDALRQAGFEVDENDLIEPHVPDKNYDICIMHPILYPMTKYPRTYRKLLQKCEEWIGFDVCDSDHISPIASYAISLFDRVAVPSKFCASVFDRCAVTSKIYVVPHHLEEAFLRDDIEPTSSIIQEIRALHKPKFLFFLWHSGFRKGADIVAEAWARVSKVIDAVLIIKRTDHYDPFIEYFEALKNVIIVEEWLSTEDLVALYDSVDVVLVPSRGGGFELNALEALARGRIVITSDWHPIREYCTHCIQIPSRGKVKIFASNTIEGMLHDGYGVDPNPDTLARRIIDVYNHLDEYRKIFEREKHRIRSQYSFEAIKPLLLKFVLGE